MFLILAPSINNSTHNKMNDNIQTEQTLLEIEKVEIDFAPILFITKTMETHQSQN